MLNGLKQLRLLARRLKNEITTLYLAARDPRTPWLAQGLRTRVRNFETVLNAYYPTVTDTSLTSWRRALLRTMASWRFHAGIYARPLELNALQRVFHYQRPETAGF